MSRVVPFLPLALAVAFLAVGLATTSDFIAIPADTAQQLTVARSLFRGEGYLQPVVWAHSGLADRVTHMPDTHGILWPFVQAVWFAALSEDSSTARVHGLVYLALTGIVTFAFARRLFGTAAGLVAMTLVLTNVNLFLFAAMADDDLSFSFFFLCTAFFLHRGLEGGASRDFWFAGLAGGAAMLAKAIGFVLPLVFLSTLLLWRSLGPRKVAVRIVGLSLPIGFGALAYFLRNYLSHGDLGFRFASMQWIYKLGGFEALAGLFDPPPTMGGIFQSLGPSGILHEVTWQLLALAGSMIRTVPLLVTGPAVHEVASQFWLPAFLPLVGLIATLLLLTRQRAFCVIALLSWLGIVLFVSLPWHFELRYFSPLVPLSAISISAAMQKWPFAAKLSPRVRLTAAGPVLVALVTLGLSALQFGIFQVELASTRFDSRVCSDSLDWIERSTAPEDRVMALDPWHVAWFTERESIVIPSGGVSAIERVARHYDTHWLLAAADLKRPETSRLLRRLDAVPAEIRIKHAYRGQACWVYRLDW
ncbi:MAG: glycosyltransferase family 39 protein [Proteobacteria bacterium]|nr:glycosyltransferase family 39 protein [Pseudomonadota bacterium]